MSSLAAMECPRWARCSVNNCPLTVEYPDWPIAEGDTGRKCEQAKSRRATIGAKYPELKFGGLTPREHSAKIRYENLSDEEREILKERGKKAILGMNLSVGSDSGTTGHLEGKCR